MKKSFKMSNILFTWIILLCGLVCIAEDDISPTFSFRLEFESRPDRYKSTTKNFKFWNAKALSENTELRFIGRNMPKRIFKKWLPTGKTDQALSFASNGAFNSENGSFSIWVTGFEWDKNSSRKESLVTIKGKNKSVTLGKQSPGKLALYSSDGKAVEIPLDFDLNKTHFIAVNYSSGDVDIYVDMLKKVSRKNFTMPSDVEELILGQVGEGGEENKAVETFNVYARLLTQGEITAKYFEEYPVILDKMVTIPKLAEEVKIDGLMDEEFWKDAAVISGMTHYAFYSYERYFYPQKFSEVEDRVYLAYDDKYLYVGYHNPAPVSIRGNKPMVAAMLKVSKTGFDTNVDADDTFFMRMRTPGGDDYRLFVNYANTHYDWTRGLGVMYEKPLPGAVFEKININWNPAWETKSTLDMDGWHLECKVPLDAFETAEKPKPGTVWDMNFARVWKTTLSDRSGWAYGGRSLEDGRLIMGGGTGKVKFGSDENVVVRLLETGNINAGKVGFKAELFNPSSKEREVTAGVDTNTGELKDRKVFSLKPGERKVYTYKAQIKDFATGILAFLVMDEKGNLNYLNTVPVIRSDKIEAYCYKYPSWDLIKYDIKCLSLAKYNDKDLSLEFSVKSSSGKTVFYKELDSIPDYQAIVEISTRGWTAGNYDISLIFRNKGKIVEKKSEVYHKKDLPEWFDNKIGYDENKPPFPWTDLKVNTKNNTVMVWGRTYSFGKSIMPEQIFTQNKKILRAPMSIIWKTKDGKKEDSLNLKSVCTWEKMSPVRSEAELTAKTGDLTLTNDFWMEYDGLCWNKLKFTTEGKETLEYLELKVPFTKEFSDVMNCNDYSIRKNGLIPDGVTYNTPDLATWVGNGTGGLQFFIDTTGSWKLEDKGTAVRIEKENGLVTLYITMVNQALNFKKQHSFEFGFTATPVKDTWHRKTFSDPKDSWKYSWFPSGGGSSDWMPGHYGWITGKGPGWENFTNFNAADWANSGPYSNFNMIPNLSSDKEGEASVREFMDEWTINPSLKFRDLKKTEQIPVSFHSKSLRDWLVWKHYQLFMKRPFRGMYHDVSHPQASSNPYGGAGYVDADGKRSSSLGLLETRELYKRLYNMMIKFYPEFQNSVFHSSGMPSMIYESFGGRFWTDENLNSRINDKQPTYRGLITPAEFRAEYMGRNLGNVSSFIGQGRIKAETCFKYGVSNIYDHIKGLCLLHDMLDPRNTGWHVDYKFARNKKFRELISLRDEQAMDLAGIQSPDYKFIPYWEQDFVKTPENMYVSFYIRKGEKQAWDKSGKTGNRVVMIICNESDYQGPVKLDLDWKKLGFEDPKKLKALNAVHRLKLIFEEKDPATEKVTLSEDKDEYAKIENGKLEFSITPWNYRMIVITYK